MFELLLITFLFDFSNARDEAMTTYNFHKLAYRALNDNHRIPVIGYGTWLGSYRKGETHEKLTKLGPEVEVGLERAIDAGYRLIETSPVYNSEEIVGRVLTKKISAGEITREEIFIATKLDCYSLDRVNVTKALMKSLKKLNTKYVDLYIVQFPKSINEDGTKTEYDLKQLWKMMIELRFRRYVKSIGVSNFNREQLELISSLGIPPAVLEIETHLTLQRLDKLAYCQRANITVLGYAPLGHMFSIIPGDSTDNYSVNEKNGIVALGDIAKKVFRTEAQVSLRYLVQMDIVPLVRTVLRDELEEWAHIFDFDLSDEEMDNLHDKKSQEFTFKIY